MPENMARRHRIQAGLAVTGATLGLTALGTKGGAVALRRIATAPKPQRMLMAMRSNGKAVAVPEPVKPPNQKMLDTARRLDQVSLGTLTTGAGVGGVGGLTFAANERALARREEKVAKSAFGVVHKATRWSVKDRDRHFEMQNRTPVPKLGEPDPDDWKRDGAPAQRTLKATPKPAAPPKRQRYSGLDPEDRRQRRMRGEQYGLAGGAGGAAATGGGLALAARGVKRQRNAAIEQNMVWEAGKERAHTLQNQAAARLAEEAHPKPGALSLRNHRRDVNAVERHGQAAVNANTQSAAWKKIGLQRSAKARGMNRAAVVAGGTALALGAGAVGVRHMRRNQGKKYTDWWDGPRRKNT